jgi:sugar phosphate isomerase/epimerase
MTRREALKLSALTAVGAWAGARPAFAADAVAKPALKLGVASITLSNLPPEAVISELKQLDIHYVTLFKTHCPWAGTPEQCRSAAKKFTDAGITVTGSGVIDLPNDEPAVRKAFENASAAGLPAMDCRPALDAYPLVEKYVKQYDIRLAIHNHGPGDKFYPSPYDAWKVIQSLDPRIGLCIDVGHAWRAGTDPAEAIRKCHTRLYDIHLKDSLAAPGAKDIPCEVGRGHMDIKGILAALIEVKYERTVAFEYEKRGNPISGLAESVAYVRKLLTEMTG